MSKQSRLEHLHIAIDAGGEPTGHAAVMGMLQISKFDRQHLESVFCSTMSSLSRSFTSVPLGRLLRAVPSRTLSRGLATGFPRDRDGGSSLSFFGRPRLPTNKGVMFVPQQEAWVSSCAN